jgi:hypothetical protein
MMVGPSKLDVEFTSIATNASATMRLLSDNNGANRFNAAPIGADCSCLSLALGLASV